MSTRDPSYDKARKLYEDGFGSLAKVAKEIGISKNTVESWKKRAKADGDDWVKAGKSASKTRARKNGDACTQKKSVPERNKIIKDEDVEVIDSSGLTEKQRLFCIYYIQSFNATQAAIKAGYSPKTAYSIGHDNLKKTEIKKFLKKLKEGYDRELFIDGKRILERHSKIAFSDIFDFIDGQRKLKPIDQIDGTLIKDFSYTKEETTFEDGGGVEKTNIKLKVEDRKPSLDFLTKYFGLSQEADSEEEQEDDSLQVVRKCHS